MNGPFLAIFYLLFVGKTIAWWADDDWEVMDAVEGAKATRFLQASQPKKKKMKKKRKRKIVFGSPTDAFIPSNSCVTDGVCIRATNNGEYRSNEYCEWTIGRDAVLSVNYFDLDNKFDFVFVNDLPGFTGTGQNELGMSINGLRVSQGDTVIFSSDDRYNFSGFEICLIAASGPPNDGGPPNGGGLPSQ